VRQNEINEICKNHCEPKQEETKTNGNAYSATRSAMRPMRDASVSCILRKKFVIGFPILLDLPAFRFDYKTTGNVGNERKRLFWTVNGDAYSRRPLAKVAVVVVVRSLVALLRTFYDIFIVQKASRC
jgi:hypothetical protein